MVGRQHRARLSSRAADARDVSRSFHACSSDNLSHLVRPTRLNWSEGGMTLHRGMALAMVCVCFVAGAARVAGAQTVAGTFADIGKTLKVGKKVSVTDDAGRKLEGKLTELS